MMATATKDAACDCCREDAASYGMFQVTTESGSQNVCNRCFNEEAARRLGLQEVFRYAAFEPLVLPGALGELHEFHFRTHLYGPGVLLEGWELQHGVPQGYHFAVSGEPDGDPSGLFERLVAKMKLGLSRRHIVESEYGQSLASDDILRGWIEWDDETQGKLPFLVVDGRPLSWNELGRILTAYEGFQIKLEIRDKTAD